MRSALSYGDHCQGQLWEGRWEADAVMAVVVNRGCDGRWMGGGSYGRISMVRKRPPTRLRGEGANGVGHHFRSFIQWAAT